MRLACAIVCVTALAAGAQAQPAATEIKSATDGAAISLAQALKLADERNINLKAARIELEKVQADLYWAWSTLLPTARGTLSFTHNDHADRVNLGGSTVTVRKQQSTIGTIQVNLPLVNAQAWLGVGLADLMEETAALGVEATRQALLRAVAETYYAALSAMQMIDISQAQIAALERHLEIASLRHRTGTGQRIDVVRTRTEMITAKENLVQAENLLDSTRYALATLLAQREKPIPIKASMPPEPPDDEQALIDLAMEQREDLKLKRALVQVSDESLNLAWMSFVPTLNASWQLNQQLSDLADLSDADKSRWFIGLTLSVPLYDNTRYADLDLARADLKRKQLEAEDTQRQAVLQVQQTWIDWHKALKLAATAEEKAGLAAETLKLAEVAYVSGSGDSLVVTDARRTSQQADLDMAIKRFDAQLALIALLRVTGYDMTQMAEGGGS